MMTCSWCETTIAPDNPSLRSHGICTRCSAVFFGAGPLAAREMIGRFEFPSMLVNSNVELIEANQEILDFVGKKISEIKGKLGGEILGCIPSMQAGGCGKTEHCVNCAVRNSVRTTHETGKPLIDVDSHHDILLKDGTIKILHLKISTVRLRGAVLLKIIAV